MLFQFSYTSGDNHTLGGNPLLKIITSFQWYSQGRPGRARAWLILTCQLLCAVTAHSSMDVKTEVEFVWQVQTLQTKVVILALALGIHTLCFFSPDYPILKFFFDFPLSLDNIHDWRRGLVDVHLKYSTHVGENWGTKMVDQKRFTDDRLGWFLQSLDVDIDDVISAHCNLAPIAQSQAVGITWHNFLSPYSHMTFFWSAKEIPK